MKQNYTKPGTISPAVVLPRDTVDLGIYKQNIATGLARVHRAPKHHPHLIIWIELPIYVAPSTHLSRHQIGLHAIHWPYLPFTGS